jgi:transcriptional regulator with XRE-family HTH domain
MSQLALALEADVSARHVSFIETGRAQPSREMVLHLAASLDVPLRERNALLLAAGFAPLYRESSLDAPELRTVQHGLRAILAKQEPFPAVVMNRHWDILTSNSAAARFFAYLLDGRTMAGPANVVRLMFDPRALRPYVVDWATTAEALIRRVHREATGGIRDDATTALLDEVLGYPDVPTRWAQPDLGTPLVPVLPVTFAKDGRQFAFFSAVTTLGTPQDITLQELRIECFYPLDDATEMNVREVMSLS